MTLKLKEYVCDRGEDASKARRGASCPAALIQKTLFCLQSAFHCWIDTDAEFSRPQIRNVHDSFVKTANYFADGFALCSSSFA